MDAALDVELVTRAIGQHTHFLLATHEDPDGDALGSVMAMKAVLEQLGKDVVIVHGQGTPHIYPVVGQEGWLTEVPADVERRCAIALDCASRPRLKVDDRFERALTTVNIDHHISNTRFAQINLVRPSAAATCELLCDLVERLGVELTPELANALYIGIQTDTGGLKFSNTTEETTQRSKWLEQHADVTAARAALDHRDPSWRRYAALVVERMEDAGNGVQAVVMTRADLEACGVPELEDKQAKDHALELLDERKHTASMIALVYEQYDGARKVSLRSESLPGNEVASALGGGGHPAAAGFTSQMSGPETVEAIVAEVGRVLARTPDAAALQL